MSRPISVPNYGSFVYDVVNNLPTEPLIAVFGHARRLAGGGTGDVEPLVDAGVNGGRRLLLARGDIEGAGVSLVGRVSEGGVGEREVVLGSLAGNELLPSLGALTDNVHGVLLVLALAGEGELVLGLAIGNLIDAEPLVGGTEKAGQVTLDILDVVELGGQGVVHVDDDDLPVGLTLVEQSHDTEDLDLDDISGLVDELANLADVERVVVAVGLGLGVHDVGVLPGLQQRSVCTSTSIHAGRRHRADGRAGVSVAYLGEGTVVPEVALVGEAVADEAQLALLDVLLDGVQGLLLGDLLGRQRHVAMHGGAAAAAAAARRRGSMAPNWGGTHLHLRIAPAGDLDDHVENRLLLVGIQRDVVPCRDGLAVLLNEDAVLERVRRSDLADRVSHVGDS
jgi:hypothetical protein